MAATFDPKRAAIVDEREGHLLIRCNMPIREDGSFAYREIQAAVDRDFSQYKTFIDISVIDCVGERLSFSLETSAFGIDADKSFPESIWPPYLHGYNPKKLQGMGYLSYEEARRSGGLYWWPFEGVPPNADPKVYLTAPGWDFAGLVDFLIKLHERKDSTNVIIFHCMLGADRTGALHRGYLMRAKGMTLAQASKEADALVGPPNADYQRLAVAYERHIAWQQIPLKFSRRP